MFKKSIVLFLLLCSLSVFSQDRITTMFYNLLEFPEASPGARDVILRNILNDYEPDIFMVCELQNQEGADRILDVSLNDEGNDFSSAPFILNESSSSPLQQLLFYRTNMFTLESTEVINTNIRDLNKYVLKLNTADDQNNPIRLYIYVVHLKASQGGDNEAERLDMVSRFTADIENIDPNSYVIFAGDLNVYTSNEDAYQELLDPTNNITMVDPINRPGNWNNNINFQDIHTQSTRISSTPFGAGAGGGLDDRFDFILISENMVDDPNLNYVPGTYKAYGNNGNCYNMDVSDPDCAGEYNLTIRSRLFSMSDHLPVVMELETDEEIVLGGTDFDASNIKLLLESTIAMDELQVRVASLFEERIRISIYNTLGQKFNTVDVEGNSQISLDISQLSAGIYYLHTNLPGVQPVKFVKTF